MSAQAHPPSNPQANSNRRRLTQDNVVCGVLLVVFAGVIWLCQDFGPRARMIPLPLAAFGIFLTVVQLLWQNLRSTDDLQMDMITVKGLPTGAGIVDAEDRPAQRPGRVGEPAAFGIVVLLIALVFLIGLLPAVFVFTAGYFVVSRHYTWHVGLIYTAVFTGAVYLLFGVALQIQPYHGLLAPLFN